MPSIKFIDLLDRKISHVIHQTDFVVGRADECALQIRDPEISRRQARIQFQQGKYRLTNTGTNPIDINGQPATSQMLEDGDLIHMASARFLVRILHAPPGTTREKKTPLKENATPGGPHLALENDDGTETIFSLGSGRVMIGRSTEADIRFEEKNVSRKHCAIEPEGDGFVAVKLSRSSAVTVNGKEIDRCGLQNDDRLHIGDHVLRFCHEPLPRPPAEPMDATAFAAEDITWERPPHLLIDSHSGNAQVFDLEGEQWQIGRDPKCDLQLDEKTVSRRHARIEKFDGAFWIENLSRSATLEVNGHPAKRQRLFGGDQIQIGPHTLIFISKRIEDARGKMEDAGVKADADPEHTIFTDSAPVMSLAPRLILDTGGDTARTFHLEGDRSVIGRSAEADIRLEDPGISRVHGAIEKEEDGYMAVNLCNQSPLKVNQEAVDRKRLYSGDRIQLGATVLSFMSDRPEDTRIATETVDPAPVRSYPMARAALMGLIVLLGGYIAYQQLYLPWKATHVLSRAAEAFADGQYEKGREIIETTLDQGPLPEQAVKAQRLLAGATLNALRHLIDTGDDEAALTLLATYLSRHGTETDAFMVWREQDRLRLKLGEKLEKAGQKKAAMNQYARVRAESIHFPKAEKHLSRLWRTDQVESLLGSRRQAAAAILVKTGEKRYGARQYFTPVNQCAYLAFRTALWLVPDHLQAREKLTAMGQFHLDRGKALMGMKNWAEAAHIIHLALLVNPSDPVAVEQLNDCRKKLASMGKKADAAMGNAARTIKQIAMAQQKLAAALTGKLVADLLDTARAAVDGQNDLTPYGKNAHTAFLAVLELDPGNAQARTGLEEIGDRIREQGLEAFAAGRWEETERYLGGTLLVDPGDGEIRERLIDCQKKLAGRSGLNGQQTEPGAWFSTYLKDS